VYNVKAAFSNADPATQLYIKIPEEMVALGFVINEEQRWYAIQLENNMYSNVDAALHLSDKYSVILMNDLGFKQSNFDPWIFLKMDTDDKTREVYLKATVPIMLQDIKVWLLGSNK